MSFKRSRPRAPGSARAMSGNRMEWPASSIFPSLALLSKWKAIFDTELESIMLVEIKLGGLWVGWTQTAVTWDGLSGSKYPPTCKPLLPSIVMESTGQETLQRLLQFRQPTVIYLIVINFQGSEHRTLKCFRDEDWSRCCAQCHRAWGWTLLTYTGRLVPLAIRLLASTAHTLFKLRV